MKKFFYRVEVGDSLVKVAKKLDVPIHVIIKQNNLIREIEAGDLLYLEIPFSAKTYIVKPCDTIKSIAKKFNKSQREILDINMIDYVYFSMLIYV
jgi:LysM repeat protein